jgi:hypothetical protein
MNPAAPFTIETNFLPQATKGQASVTGPSSRDPASHENVESAMPSGDWTIPKRDLNARSTVSDIRPSPAPIQQAFDPRVPNVARIYDYLLRGKVSRPGFVGGYDALASGMIIV